MSESACPVCQTQFSGKDMILRHLRNLQEKNEVSSVMEMDETIEKEESFKFQHPFSMVVSVPSGNGKMEWTRKLLLPYLVRPPSERVIWCFGQWQPLYDEIQYIILCIEFEHGIPDNLNSFEYINANKRNLLVFDELMTEAKCDQRIADLFTKSSHHRSISIVYLNQNLSRQGKYSRDIAYNTQYLVLFNTPVGREQLATLARRMHPSNSGILMKRFGLET